MSDFNLDKVIRLLENANEQGINVSFADDELSVRFQKGNKIDKVFLDELKLNKPFLIHYFKTHAAKGKKASLPPLQKSVRNELKGTQVSFAQERLWFIDQLEGSVQYHIPTVLQLKGNLNIDALTFAIQQIVNRHEVLRTVIRESEGQAWQYIKEKDGWQLNMVDGSMYLDGTDRFQNYIQQLINETFDLSKDYMIRAHLLMISEQNHVLVVTLHHIASDGWSTSIIVRELVELYESFEKGRVSGLLPLPIQYADFAIWQRQYLQGGVLDKKLAYWKEKLQGLTTLQLPVDYERPTVQGTRGAANSFNINKDVLDQIQLLSQEQGTTLFMTLLAVFNVLLYRHTGQQDICVGTPIAGRQQQEVEGLIGFFVNTLALRSQLNDNLSFLDLLKQVKATTLEAYDHQEVPFEKVVEVVVKERDMSRSPLFQVMLVLQNTPDIQDLRLGELQLSHGRTGLSGHNTSKFELTFNIKENVQGLYVLVEYCTDLFNEPTIKRLMVHFNELLNSVLKAPQQKISELSMLSSSEKRQLLVEFNDTKVDYPKDKRIVDLFEQQVLKAPAAIALVFEEEQLTYGELNERSNQLANYLRIKGVKEEMLVPLCIDRSIEMIVSVLGILKAGAAYVPIDPEYPEERIHYMLADTAAAIIISSKENITKLPNTHGIEIIDLKGDWPVISKQSADNLQIVPDPNNLAYVLYTSGSTGKPKGVRMPGSGLVNLLSWQQKQFSNKNRRVLQFASLNFDVSFQEIFSTLCFGSELYLISSDRRKDIAEILKDLERYRITHLFIPYIVLKNLAEYILPLSLDASSLEEIIVAGEQLKLTDDIQNLINKKVRLVNQYGPTEAHVVSSYVIDPNGPLSILPPIGKPIDNTFLCILGDKDQLVPIGVTGELHIGGVQVARGYLNLPALNAEKFIKDTFSKEAGPRMYRTGDLAKWLPDGNIEYLGRKDDQVKVRGYRIELGEIESVLQQSELVSQAVVMAKEDEQGNKRLVAYIVPNNEFERERILSYLKEKLPGYMVPALLIQLETLPLTANGKVDRKSLPDPGAAALSGDQYIAPRNSLEVKLAEIWQQLLQLERIGIHNNFFELGGHSLLAMRLVSAIRKKLEVEIAIKSLFNHPTISTLATHLAAQGKGLLLPPIEVQPRPDYIPLSFSQERLWFIDQLEGSVQYHLPTVLRLTGKLNFDALVFALQQMINRHEVLRTVILQKEGSGYQYIKEKDSWQLQIVDGSIYKEDIESLQQYIKQLIDVPFNLSKDYMLRAALISLDKDDHVLVVTLHHIASDGWSTSIMVSELVELYNACAEQRAVALVTLPIQYADYALWQRTYLQGEAWDMKLGYWKDKLEGVGALQLPVDYSRPLVQSTNGATTGFKLDKALSEQLQSLSRQQGATLFMTLLAAFNVLLYRYSGQQDICVGTPIAGRQQQELEGLIGFFVNTLALRSELMGSASFKGLLQQVRVTTLEAYDHQEVPFEKVVELAVKERDMSRSPLFQVMLVLQNTPDIRELRLGELQLSREVTGSSGYNTSKFELTFNITETVQGLYVSVEYCTGLFTERTILRMADHFSNLLQSIVKAPNQSIGTLPMLNEAEINHLVVELNDTKRTFSNSRTVVGLFAEQVLKAPQAIALVFGVQQLTYIELNERSNRLAHYLRSKGIKEETLVPVCMYRSIEMITAMLGILKAGGAYVPIDPDYPVDRIGYMLGDTGALLILTSKEIIPRLPALANIEIIDLQEHALSINKEPAHEPQVSVEAHHLAYVIYTSGSTGKPKGVMIEHKSLANLVNWHNGEYSVSASSRATAMAGVGFDAFGWEVWPYLSCGANLYIIDDGTRLDPPRLVELFIANNISHSFIATALVQDFVNESGNKKTALQYLLTGGDKLPSMGKKGLSYKLVNNYGPTENTVVASNYELFKNNEHLIPPIGKAISNTVIYLLNEHQQLVPEGIPGEICIGGTGLARGYLNRPDLTAEKFINDPFNKTPGSRLYKSGDQGRWLPDGNIAYLGRIDEQVKIRGYRIELGEVESVLQECAAVRQAVVLAKEDQEGNKRLVGYIVAEGSFERDVFVSYLKDKLPEYMVPALWVEMAQFPLTNNGKIDKKALPDPDGGGLVTNEYVAPRNELEAKLVEIWQELLQVERVGIHDDFFELGGHSLLAMRMVAYIERSLLISIPIKVLFHFTRISDLSIYLAIQANGQREENSTAFKLMDV